MGDVCPSFEARYEETKRRESGIRSSVSLTLVKHQ